MKTPYRQVPYTFEKGKCGVGLCCKASQKPENHCNYSQPSNALTNPPLFPNCAFRRLLFFTAFAITRVYSFIMKTYNLIPTLNRMKPTLNKV